MDDAHEKERLNRYRSRIDDARANARHLLDGGATGIQAAAAISQAVDSIIADLFADVTAVLSDAQRQTLERHSAVVAVGGTGRGEMAPFSDVDLLFVYRKPARLVFSDCVGRFVRDAWDVGIKLGHAIRDVKESISLARQDPQIATSLIEARHLCGNVDLVDELKRKFHQRVIQSRLRAFIESCIRARENERQEQGGAVQQLQPDIKRSLGGLRDVHLIRWVGFAKFQVAEIDSLQLHGALGMDDARSLLDAYEFLTRLRMELHFAACRSQDTLTRDDQLRFSRERNFEVKDGQRPVERFMQQYFRHSMEIANVTKRFISLNRPKPLAVRLGRLAIMRRVDQIFRLTRSEIDIVASQRDAASRSLDQILKLYSLAAQHELDVAPVLSDRIKKAVPDLDTDLSAENAEVFLQSLGTIGNLAALVRNMHDNGVLEFIIPEMRRVRCLLQFNQYHSYTVDEHTLRAIEAAEGFREDGGPVGTAYRAINQKNILHLAVLLHDAGKGFEEDHSEVGRRIAESVADRLLMNQHDRQLLAFLVHKHLMMSHLAFRRDISDPECLIQFSHEVGSPETLRMLYVLTAADLRAVGPGVWTDWKAELLSELYDRTMMILSGKHYDYREAERLSDIKDRVLSSIVPMPEADEAPSFEDWVDKQLQALSPIYLSATSSDQIAADLTTIHNLKPGEIIVIGKYDAETNTVEYRVITDQAFAEGCSHRITGVLTAKRMEILSAQITTTLDGIVVDGFRVMDNDFDGRVLDSRIEDVAKTIKSAIRREVTTRELFQRNRRFDSRGPQEPISELPMRVTIDNESSELCTIVSVFAHDRPGLLYTICRTAFQSDLSIELAKIATHLDQVVDVFYVTGTDGLKIVDPVRLDEIRGCFESKLTEFEQSGFQRFVA